MSNAEIASATRTEITIASDDLQIALASSAEPLASAGVLQQGVEALRPIVTDLMSAITKITETISTSVTDIDTLLTALAAAGDSTEHCTYVAGLSREHITGRAQQASFREVSRLATIADKNTQDGRRATALARTALLNMPESLGTLSEYTKNVLDILATLETTAAFIVENVAHSSTATSEAQRALVHTHGPLDRAAADPVS